MKSTVYRNSERNKYVFRYVNTQSSFGDSEVPVEDWEWFLEMFSNQHQGWLVNVFRYPAEKKHEKFPQIIDRPLTHIGIDRKLSRPEVQISAAGSDSEAPIYQVPDPTRLILKQDSKGAHEGLDISSADGSVTSVRFRVPARPETLDGILAISAKATWVNWRIPVAAV